MSYSAKFNDIRQRLKSQLFSIFSHRISNYPNPDALMLPLAHILSTHLHSDVTPKNVDWRDLALIATASSGAVSVTDSGLRDIYDDVIAKRGKRDGVGFKVRVLMSELSFEKIMETKRSLDHFFVSGTGCRITHLCDFCDFTIAVATLLSMPFQDAYRAFGGSYGHSHVSRSTLPLTQAAFVGSSASVSASKFGGLITDIDTRWRPESLKTPSKLTSEQKVIEVKEITKAISGINHSEADSEVAHYSDQANRSVSRKRSPSPFYLPTSPVLVPASASLEPTVIKKVKVVSDPLEPTRETPLDAPLFCKIVTQVTDP
jgi:hypothetical protein